MSKGGNPEIYRLRTQRYHRVRRKDGGTGGAGGASKILADQLTLSQPGVSDYAPLITKYLPTQIFRPYALSISLLLLWSFNLYMQNNSQI